MIRSWRDSVAAILNSHPKKLLITTVLKRLPYSGAHSQYNNIITIQQQQTR